jgi:hypothetical protein
MDDATALTQLRWTRSEPPGLAASDEDRRATYCAALQQFEELLATARVAGPASKPLPLFYALSQAGRAIVAAHGEKPETHGHGLREVPGGSEITSLLDRSIERNPRKDGLDTFGAVARATQSGDFDGTIKIGALWVANPHSPRLPLEHWKPDWRLALTVLDENAKPPEGSELQEHTQILRVVPFSDPPEATKDHGEDLGHDRYPTIPEHSDQFSIPRSIDTVQSWNGYVIWRTDWATLDEVAPRTTFGDQRYLVPLLPEQTKMLSPLLIWWVLLYGFSVYARYEPQLWLETLAVDRSSAAVGIEHLLTSALNWVPNLVYEAVLGKFYPVPHGYQLT